jgi:GMP synthase (glutamine-hydrolysing)
VNVLSVIHGANVPAGVFGDVVEEAGHRLENWSLAWGTPPPRSIDDYGAVLVFGGAMHADQDDRHPWLREENLFLQRLFDRHVPVLGVCLGIQLIAKAEGARVYPLEGGPEIGWVPVELTEAAASDPVLGRLPASFDAFGWHYYTYDLPAGAEELARSSRCNQAFRLGEVAWGIQFHAEVTLEIIERWFSEEEISGDLVERETFLSETEQKISEWNHLGRTLCAGFVEVAERVAIAV